MLDWVGLLFQPVALFAWALLGLSWLSWRRPAPLAARWIATTATILYLLLSTPVGANLVVGALEGSATQAAGACLEPAPGGTIVVLAGGIAGEPASGDEIASLQEASLRRVIEGVRLARSTPDARLILSGGSGGAVREADLMASLATALGFPRARLLLERESTTTAEGARNVARVLAQLHGGRAVHLVTSAMHMPRAAASFRRQGVEVCPVPVDRRRVHWVRPTPQELLTPQITALDKSNAACHELIGYVAYWATGRL